MSDVSLWEACRRAVTQKTFYNAFARTFEIIEADSDDLRREAFRLRYKVFCAENKIDLPHDKGLEYDAYDERAVQHLLIHKEKGLVAGTVRTILPDPDRPLFSFPLQEICDHPFLHSEKALQLCEISRLCMAREFRQRPDDGSVLPAFREQEEHGMPGAPGLTYLRRRIPYAPLGLFHAAFKTALAAGTLNCVALMDPMQFRSLRKLGMDYRVLGPRLTVHGRHQPLVMNIKAVLDHMADRNPVCWEVLSDRGKLMRRANELASYEWHDTIFDESTREGLIDKLF